MFNLITLALAFSLFEPAFPRPSQREVDGDRALRDSV
jgi:hypothetical protein